VCECTRSRPAQVKRERRYDHVLRLAEATHAANVVKLETESCGEQRLVARSSGMPGRSVRAHGDQLGGCVGCALPWL
jgi:hypothetical protein